MNRLNHTKNDYFKLMLLNVVILKLLTHQVYLVCYRTGQSSVHYCTPRLDGTFPNVIAYNIL